MKDNYTHIVNFDYASRCEIGKSVLNILREYVKKNQFLDTEYTYEIYEEAKRRISQLIGAAPEEIALLPDTSLSINIVAQSLPLGVKNEILLPTSEPPENIYPWFRLEDKGFHVDIFDTSPEIDLDTLLKKLHGNILIMPLTHVDINSGFKRKMKIINKYLKEFNIMMLMNASYSIGSLNIKPREVKAEILVSNGDKWLCGLPGSGFIYIKKEIISRFNPALSSIYGDIEPYNLIFRRYRPKDDASRMQVTEPNPLSYLILSTSIKEILELGIEKIENKILTLGGWLIDELEKMRMKVITPYERNRRGGIISIYTGEDGVKLKEFLLRRGIKVSFIKDTIRISLHYRHEEEDIYLLLEGLEEGMRRLGLFPSHSL